MNLSKFKPQRVNDLKKNQPDLYATVKRVFPQASDDEFGRVAGLIIEYVIQSGGDVDIFGDEDVTLLSDDEDDDGF